MRKNVQSGVLMIIGVMLSLSINITLSAAQSTTSSTRSTASTYNPAVCAGTSKLPTLTQDCQAMIDAFPRPVVAPITEDKFTLSNYSFWRVGPDAVPTFDTPNGNVIGEIPAGFNFVNAVDLSIDSWLQIEGGQWIQRDRASYKEPSYFHGVKLLNGLDHPFAFVLDLSQIYVSATPGGPASEDTGRFLERYELVNIFDEAVDAEGWTWYMIGTNQWVKQTFVARVEQTERPEGVSGRWVAVDLYEQTLIAYENDTPVFATLVSTGIPPHDTNEGLFKVWERVDRDPMSGATGAPSAYALQMVPWVMYFDDSISLHGTYWHDLFGYRQSHGCVNLSVSDAKFLFDWFSKATPDADGTITNYVYVHSSGTYGQGVIRQNS
ncbi:MAG TPA: L,D-transpeptidase [Phototrophicaceae bacterium]|jgi:hypothetical protein|nr:L,D-transpeptidase [Phototrophicaceae bacterium]